MRTKLLKSLRKKFYIEYCLNYKHYTLYTPHSDYYFEDLDECKRELVKELLFYVRNRYQQHLRTKRIN